MSVGPDVDLFSTGIFGKMRWSRFNKIARNQDRVLSGFLGGRVLLDRVLLDFIGFLSGRKSGFYRVFCRIFRVSYKQKLQKNQVKRRSTPYLERIFEYHLQWFSILRAFFR